jgi:hypothetical protein
MYKMNSKYEIKHCISKNKFIKKYIFTITKRQRFQPCRLQNCISNLCQNCDSVYMGETTREKAIRTKEHQKNVKNMDLNSKIFQHVYQNSHSMNFNDFYSSFILPIFKKHSYIYHSSISCKDMTKKCSLNNNAIS